jgi:hypothetical protein
MPDPLDYRLGPDNATKASTWSAGFLLGGVATPPKPRNASIEKLKMTAPVCTIGAVVVSQVQFR